MRTEECAARQRASGGTTEELADLLLYKVGLGAIDDEVLMGLGYWSQQQVDKATRIVRLEQYPGEYAHHYAFH